MAKTQLELTPKERQFCDRLFYKVRSLDTTEEDPAVMAQLQAVEFLVDSLESLVSLRMAWAGLLKDEPNGALH